jgi:hypothetical protein
MGQNWGVKMGPLDIIFVVISASFIKACDENFFFKCNIC